MVEITRKVLFVAEDLSRLSSLQRRCRGRFDITIARDGEGAKKILQQQGPFAVVVSDDCLSGMSGAELCREIGRMTPTTVKLLLADPANQETALSALRHRFIDRLLNQPCPWELLEATLEESIEHHRLVHRERLLMEELRQRHATCPPVNRNSNQVHSETEQDDDPNNISKSQFLAQMSHEVRTPLTAILGFADLMMYEQLDASEQQHALRTIRKNGDHLLELLNDVLELSKIEAGKLEVRAVACSVPQVLSDIASLMRVRARSKNLSLVLDYATAIPERICTDPMRLRQILMNLVANAIKFTEFGQVRIRAGLQDDGPEPILRFDVIDSGIGITAAQASRLFKPFTQAADNTAEKFGGTGLGLTISKRLAHLLGGDISFTSKPGCGSTFTVMLRTGPLEGAARWEHPSEALLDTGDAHFRDETDPHPLAGRRILLADDSPDNRTLLSFILQRAGANVKAVENGLLAVEMLQKNEDFDLVLMDMQMPVMDGFEAVGAMRQRGYVGQIVALTANVTEADRAQCMAAGCNDFLGKPINRRQLLDQLAHRLSPVSVAS